MPTPDQHISIAELAQKHPQALELLERLGITRFQDPAVLNNLGTHLRLGTLLQRQGIDTDDFLHQLADIEAQNSDDSIAADVRIDGLLPCPVRLPITEALDAQIQAYQERTGLHVQTRLEAASVGADGLNAMLGGIESVAQLPDIFVCAGFETFFDRNSLARWKESRAFTDILPPQTNPDFADIDVRDPDGDYSIIAVVPAVFVVHLENAPELAPPRTWADILRPEYQGRVALPVSDFDLFNGILLNIHREFGDEGITALARSMMTGMHPAQMVQSANRTRAQKPFVTIMPYFFTRMVRDTERTRIVWPEDGSIICPVFMLVRRDRAEQVRELAECLGGPEIARILSHNGRFPSLHPEIDNQLPARAPFKWLGWDYIHSNDIGALIDHSNRVFLDAANAREENQA